MDRLAGLLERAENITGGPRSTTNGSATVQINAGGVAVWVAATACLVMLAVVLVGTIFVAVAMSDLNRQTQELRERDDMLQAYINVAYGAQPEEGS